MREQLEEIVRELERCAEHNKRVAWDQKETYTYAAGVADTQLMMIRLLKLVLEPRKIVRRQSQLGLQLIDGE